MIGIRMRLPHRSPGDLSSGLSWLLMLFSPPVLLCQRLFSLQYQNKQQLTMELKENIFKMDVTFKNCFP